MSAVRSRSFLAHEGNGHVKSKCGENKDCCESLFEMESNSELLGRIDPSLSSIQRRQNEWPHLVIRGSFIRVLQIAHDKSTCFQSGIMIRFAFDIQYPKAEKNLVK